MSELQNLLTLLDEYATKAKEITKNNLKQDNRVATGKLLDSISTKVVKNNLEFSVELHFEDYFKYVSEGRKPGKQPPLNKILEWIKVKPILPRPDSNGKLPTEKQLAYLIARKIGREGYEGTKNYEQTMDVLNKEYLPKLQDALEKDFVIYSLDIFNSLSL